MFRVACLTAILVAATAIAAAPASAKHKMSCYDYAWESQDQKDCLAGKSKAPMHKAHAKHMKHKMEMKDEKKS